jgi:DNA modification methylase
MIADVINNTPFMVADVINWKKNSALPQNISPNKLTRICEFVFVLCRKSEYMTYTANKPVTSVRETGQKMYGVVYNYISAPNNDGSCSLNKDTYSTELCTKLLNIYAKEGSVVYDPFMGTGTTAVACKQLGHTYIGSELSPNQCEYATNRLFGIKKIENKQLVTKELF